VYKTVEQTLFLGKNVVFVPECPSTNDLAASLLPLPSTVEGTVVITNHQRAGRGQRGNTWHAEPGQNLTFSIILKPTFLPVKEQFYLTVITALGIYDFLKTKLDDKIHIKWPNDILILEKKVCGILIENQVQKTALTSSIVGIGLNIGQENFSLPSATSLKKITGKSYSLQDEFQWLLSFIEARYLLLRHGKHHELLRDYLQVLYRINETHFFKNNDQEFEGAIEGVDAIGKLQIRTTEGIRTFDLKEIQFV
jgi:BirA family biotin operon repressor/biotin-[acetyl-CoA-carboxylase] ligase